jgi:4-oxalocrotonate tautomerase
MPHIIVKLWSGRSEEQKRRFAEAVVKNATAILDCEEKSVSVGFEDIQPQDWEEKVVKPDIQAKWETLYKKPAYDLPK